MEYSDLSEEQVTKRQHYVPKAYLKHFSFDEQKRSHVYAVFPNGKESQSVSIEKLCCQSYLYDQIAVDPDSGAQIFAAPNEIEGFFSIIESRYATIISKLKSDLQEKNDFELTAEEIGALRGFLLLLLWRNPIFVHISNCIVDMQYAQNPEYIEHIQEMFPDVPPNVFISHLAHEFLKKQLLISTLALAETMEDSQICIFRTQSSSFITSAMPVMNLYGENNGIKYDLIGMPITPDFFLAFVDVDTCLSKVVTIDEYSVKRINGRYVGSAGNVLISNKKDLLSYIDFSFEPEEDNDLWLYEMLHTDKESALKRYKAIMNSKEIKYWR